MPYAEKTKVPVAKSKAEIETICRKHGATAFGTMDDGARVRVVFRAQDRNVMFTVLTPDNPQEERSVWRLLLLAIKAKFESVDRGVEEFEEAFLSNIVMPDGQTVGDHTRPAIARQYEGGKNIPLLPGY